MRVLALALPLFAVLAFAQPAEACSCVSRSNAERAAAADVVVSGRVLSVEALPGPYSLRRAEIAVLENFRGAEGATITLNYQVQDGVNCGSLSAFAVGAERIIFAIRRGDMLALNMCTEPSGPPAEMRRLAHAQAAPPATPPRPEKSHRPKALCFQ